jgi:hypothetical protein
MLPKVKQTVSVHPGGVTHVQSSELVPGTTADVMTIPESEALPIPKLAKFIGSATGGFVSPAEVDAFIRRERDAWPA